MKLYTTSISYFTKDGYSVYRLMNIITTKKGEKILLRHDFFDRLNEAKTLETHSETYDDIWAAIVADINQFGIIKEDNNDKQFGLDVHCSDLVKVVLT